jgi:hypothetical protein
MAVGACTISGYDRSMEYKKLLQGWPYLAGMLGLVILGIVLLLSGSTLKVFSTPVEIVTDHPLHVNHVLPELGKDRAVTDGHARVDIPVDYYDFGKIRASDVVRRDFLVINHGSGPLVIEQAYTTCGCTTAELTASIIPPGKASRVTIIFNAGFHPVAGQTVRRGLILETNDPERPEAEIWVEASVSSK